MVIAANFWALSWNYGRVCQKFAESKYALVISLLLAMEKFGCHLSLRQKMEYAAKILSLPERNLT